MNNFTKSSLLVFLLGSFTLAAQNDAYYTSSDSKGKKYIVSAGYGLGTSDWFSNRGGSSLFDRDGNLIPSANGHFKASNPTNCTNLEVAAPFSGIRLGLGVSFENDYLNELTLTGGSFGSGGSKIIFDQNFGLEKLYASIEVPFKSKQSKNFEICFKGVIGFYGYSGGATHPDFFGGNALPSTFYTGIGILADYRISRHMFVFINPLVEYNYFKNTSDFDYSSIVHNIVNFSVIAGIRLDVSRD